MDIKELCRTCLQANESMLNIFNTIEGPDDSNHPIFELLKSFTGISVSRNDGFPDQICCDCTEEIRQSLTFKLKSVKSEAILKQLKGNDTNVIDFLKFPSEFELNTGTIIEFINEETYNSYNEQIEQTSLPELIIIKQENLINEYKPLSEEHTEDYKTSTYEELAEIFKVGTSEQEMSLIEEVKQEPGIDLNIEEGHSKKTKLDVKSLKSHFRCSLCVKTFKTKGILKAHMKIHSEQKQALRQEVYRKKLLYSSSLVEPTAGSFRKYKCPTCSKLFRFKYRLNEHMRIHTGEYPFHCELCEKKFRLKSSLATHMQTAHPDRTANTLEFKCGTCSKQFYCKHSLKVHMRIHSDNNPFQCKLCPKKFRLLTFLTEHMETFHPDGTKTRKFKCTTCSKVFRHRYRLNEHMRVHTGEEPFQCEICQKKFRSKSNLAKHIEATHPDGKTNKKKNKCPICGKMFRWKCKLNVHKIIHTKRKRYQCENCPKKFLSKDYLEGHNRRMHDAKTQKIKAK